MEAAPRSALNQEALTVLKLLQRQAGHYRKLRELSKQQAELIRDQQAERLLGVLGERQGHVEALTNLSRQLEPLRPRLTSITATAPAALRDGIRAATEEVKALLSEIIRRDRDDQARLQEQQDQVRTEIRGLQPRRAAVNAYGGAPVAPGRPLTRHSA